MHDIRDFGAVGDGLTDCTTGIQQAIDTCHAKGGGVVRVCEGHYLFYTIQIKSGVNLTIEHSATLIAGEDPDRYPEIEDNDYWQPRRASRGNRRTIIYAEGAKGIGLTGRGRIECRGQLFMNRTEGDFPLHTHWTRKHDTRIPGRCILFVGCVDVLIEDIAILNAPGWSAWILDCDRVSIHRMKVDCDHRIPNVDGIHVSACRDVVISDCMLMCGDDALIVRAHQEQLWRPKPCERVAVSNCTLQSGSSAIRIGWSNDHEIRDCSFSNLVVKKSLCGISVIAPEIRQRQFDPFRWPGVSPEPPDVAPFHVHDLRFDSISMEVETNFMNINLGPGLSVKGVENLYFNNINAVCGCYPFITSQPDYSVQNIVFNNIDLEIRDMGRTDSNYKNYLEYKDHCVFSHARNLTFNQFRIRDCSI